MWRRCLEEECPPARRVLVWADALTITGWIVNQLQAVLVGEERVECGWQKGQGFGDDLEESFPKGREFGYVSLYNWAQLRMGGWPLEVSSVPTALWSL